MKTLTFLLAFLLAFIRANAQVSFLGPDILIGPSSSFMALGENSIAVNPYNPYNIFSLSNGYYNGGNPNSGLIPFFSDDGGFSWAKEATSTALSNNFKFILPFAHGSVDPAVVFDRNNNAYMAYLGNSPYEVIFLKSSANFPNYSYYNYPNFGTIIPNTINADKTALQISNSPIFEYNELYLGYRGPSPPADILVNYSVDEGNSWSSTADNLTDASTGFNPPVGANKNFGICLSSGPKGKEYAVWNVISNNLTKFIGFSSIESRLSNPIAAWQSKCIPNLEILTNPGGLSISINQQDNTIYIVWAGIVTTPVNTFGNNIFLIKSSDDGLTWSAPTPISTQTANPNLTYSHAKLTIDPFTGLMGALYYAIDPSQTYPGGFPGVQTTKLAMSEDFGATWNEQEISDNNFNMNFGTIISNDYLDLKIINNWVVPIWSDTRSGFIRAYTQPFNYPIDQNIILPDSKNPETAFYEIHKANDNIESDPIAGYEAGEYINAYAGQTIHLQTNFHTANGNRFHAHIESAPSPFNSSERKRAKDEPIDDVKKIKVVERFFAYPNPSNSKINIGLSAEESTIVTIELFDSFGNSVKKLINNRHVDRGTYFYELLFENEGINTGIYFCKINTSDESKTLKICYIKE